MATTEVGALSVKITSDTSGLTKGVKTAETNLAKVSKAARNTANAFVKMGLTFGAAAAAASTAIISSNLKTIDSLAKTADKLGVTTEALQGLQHAGELTGVSVDTMNMALQRMTRRVAEAANGTGEAVKALDELGLSAEELNSLSPDEQMLKIAGAMEEVTNQSDRVRLAMKLFDSEGVALVNTLGQGEDALKAMTGEVETLGASITRVDAAKIEMANDAMLRASKASAGFAQQLTTKVAPSLTAVVNELTNVENGTSGVEEAAQKAFDAMITGAGFVGDVFRGWELIIKGLEVSFKGMGLFINEVFAGIARTIDESIDFAKESINELIEFANNVPGIDIEKLVVGGESGISSFFKSSADIAKNSFEEAQAELVKLAMTPLPSEELDKFVAKANEAAQAQAEAIAEAVKTPVGTASQKQESGDDALPSAIEQYEVETIGLLEAMGIRFSSQEEVQIAANMRELELLKEQQEAKLITEKEFQDKSTELQRRNSELQRSMMVSQLNDGLTAIRSNSKKVDKAMRAAAIVQATIKGQQAAVDAWQAGMSVGGPFAPAVAAAYTASSLANTASMINSIRSGGSQSSAPSGSVGSADTVSGSNGGGSSSGGTNASQAVTINLVGDNYSSDQVRELIGQINEATSDGVQLNVGA